MVTLGLGLYASSLSIEVDNLRDSKGEVVFSVYNKDGSIPDQKLQNFYKQKKAKIIENHSEVVFSNLPNGEYAVNILHDENKNGEIDKGFLLPKEGIGFSNFESIGLMNKPNFKKAKFELNGDKTLKVKVIYF